MQRAYRSLLSEMLLITFTSISFSEWCAGGAVQFVQHDATYAATWTAKTTQGFQALENVVTGVTKLPGSDTVM